MQQIIDDLLETLEPIVAAWKRNHPVNAKHIPDSARACLYQDIYALGYVIFTADRLGQGMEIRTLAELLATIAKGPTHPDRNAMEQRLVDKITASVTAGKKLQPSLPQSISVARAFDDRNNTSEAPKIEHLFDKLLDCFILRDGNVTSEELAVVKAYEDLWRREPY